MTHPTDDSLKPCPFCGGAAALHPRTCDKDTPYNPADRAFPIVRCGQCGAEAVGKNWGRPETAAEKWNTRALLAEQARTEPVGWRYRTNGVHVHFSEVLPPDDAYDPGTLVALYEQPPPLKAEQAKDAAEDAPSAVELLARVIELEKALSAMLTHMGMDEDEWNKPTFDQARAALRKGHYGDAKTST